MKDFEKNTKDIVFNFINDYSSKLLTEDDFLKLENKKEYLDKRINAIINYSNIYCKLMLYDTEFNSLNKEQKEKLINFSLENDLIINEILFNELEKNKLKEYLNNRIKNIEDYKNKNFSNKYCDSLFDFEIAKLSIEQKEKYQKLRWYHLINEPRIVYSKLEFNLLEDKYKKEYMDIRFSNILKYNNTFVIFLDYEWKLLPELKIKKYFEWLYNHISNGMINVEKLLGEEKANLYNNYIKNKFDQLTDYQKKSFVKNRLDEILEFNNAYAHLESYEYALLTKDERKIYFDFYIHHFNSGRGYKPERILRDCYDDYLEYINKK